MENLKKTEVRNVINVGHSVGITIPASMARAFKLAKGSRVDVVETKEGLTIKPHAEDAELTPEFVSAMNDAYGQYRDALESLRKSDE